MEEQILQNSYDRETDPAVIRIRQKLFNQYVQPYLNMIYKLCINYTDNPEDVEENYTEVLANFYRNIETYDTSRSICTWLHIVTKRHVFKLNDKRKKYELQKRELACDNQSSDCMDKDPECLEDLTEENYHSLCSDEVAKALDRLKPIYRNALLLQQAGYSIKEIAEIEHRRGTLDSCNLNTVKSRLLLAHQFLRKYLSE